MKNIALLIVAIVIAVSVGYLSFAFGTTYIRNQAIDGCAQASKNVYTEEGDKYTRVIQEPDKNAYKSCLELKKIQ